jgi:hypothetical protein
MFLHCERGSRPVVPRPQWSTYFGAVCCLSRGFKIHSRGYFATLPGSPGLPGTWCSSSDLTLSTVGAIWRGGTTHRATSCGIRNQLLFRGGLPVASSAGTRVWRWALIPWGQGSGRYNYVLPSGVEFYVRVTAMGVIMGGDVRTQQKLWG